MANIKKKLGDLLIESRVINFAQLQEALRVQQQTGDRLGRVLVNLGYVSEQDIANVLEVQLGITQIKLGNILLLPDTIKLVPDNLIRQHRIVPIKKEGNKLTVAMVDPLNVVILDDLQIATGCIIEPVLATEREIESAVQKLFGFQDLINQAVREFEVMPSANVPTFDLDEIPDDLTEEAPTVRIVNSLFQQAIRERASDIHFEPHAEEFRVRYRIDGVLKDMMILPRQSIASILSRIKIMGEMDIAEKRIPLDGRIQIKMDRKNIDLRVSTIPTIFGEKAVIRILDKNAVVVKLDQLGFSPDILEKYRQQVKRSYGMILITGPTGSGKTTTLYSTLNEILSPEKNIITIEDPVEYVIDQINQIRVNQKSGLTFATGLRAILRQDPDIIMVGEIRDSETASIAVRAATTGHMVYSTLHTNDAAGALPRLVDMDVEPFLVASSVVAIVAQRLIRVICPICKKPYELPNDTPERRFLGIRDGVPVTLYRGTGCQQCGSTGYRGRMAIQEMLVMTQQQRKLVLARAPANELRQSAIEQGMVTITQDGIQKALIGITTIDEIMRVASTEEL
ncbi:GspE/PulE family protein [Candidatus Formimonas warabiya]|uniref:Type II secretion system protein GspE n=1 Tax=Formimonas warabiya TaxID=1761012 RepID=A0A3G1KNF4_FORW1|nr:GspE/PulE family protein [Candidatus Formimonas warabiya]ATW23987.1 type II secretion system protein GspE [Candidatus Formimonas warabiya]